MATGVWRVWVDTGGTFTDCVALSSSGEIRRRKVLSSGRIRTKIACRPSRDRILIEAVDGTEIGFFDRFKVVLPQGETASVQRHVAHVQEGPHEFDGNERLPTGRLDALALCGLSLDTEEAEFQHTAPRSEDGSDPGFVELDSQLEAPVLGLHLLFGVAPGDDLPPLALRLGSTKGTNALLERKGARSALVVTKGFADLIEIGDQSRPELFALEIKKPEPLYETVVEVEERVGSTGEVLLGPVKADSCCWRMDGSLQLEGSRAPVSYKASLRSTAAALAEQGIESVAVSFLHAYQYPNHERGAAKVLAEAGLKTSVGSELSTLAGYFSRTNTAIVDAYLSPLFRRYLTSIAESLRLPFEVMTSAGGLVSANLFRAKDGLLSGPAGGVVGCAEACAAAGFSRALAFDMGGTSTDVSRISEGLEYDRQHEVAGTTVVSPALAIRTVAAGGGSVCLAQGGRLQVGPQSAGADPGPACYGRGGPLTITDVNLLLGRIDGKRFEVPLDTAAARSALAGVVAQVEGIESEELLEGFLAIANERMAETIRRVSTRRGFDPKSHVLVAFGGAGGQHACELAELLEIGTVLVPEDCSLLSARGIGAALHERIVQRQILLPVEDSRLEAAVQQAEEEVITLLRDGADVSREPKPLSGVPRAEVDTVLNLRYRGQDSGIELAAFPLATLKERFVACYEQVFGYGMDRAVEVEWSRTRGRVASAGIPRQAVPQESRDRGVETIEVWDGLQRALVPLVERLAVPVGERAPLQGPALISEPYCSTWLAPGWSATVEPNGNGLVLRR